jgi:uncharacterized protein (TIGR02466 family)
MSKDDTLHTNWYFATPIYYMHKGEWLKDLIKLTDPYIQIAKKNTISLIEERNKKLGGDKKDHGFVHHSTSLINRPGFKTLEEWIQATTWNLLNDQGYDLRNYKIFITELWVQEFAEIGGGHHTLHTHFNGHMSGFYFLKASEKTSFPVFGDPRPGKIMNDLPQKDPNAITSANSEVFYSVRPGSLIIFNSYLPHLYGIDNGYEPFRFIHFNCRAVPINDVLTHYGEDKIDLSPGAHENK